MTEPPSPADVLAAVRRAERSGDYLAAFDLASRGLEQHPDAAATADGLALRHRAVLALARSGATRRARTLMTAFGLDGHADPEIAALAARLAKDEALAATGADRARLARIAADRYAAVHDRAGGHYPAVNAATMYRLAGDRARSDQLARAALAAAAAPADGLDAYWAASSAAEAQLLLGDIEAARATIARARALNPDDHAALASTLRQLGVLVDVLAVPPDVVRPLAPPAVIHYTGHRIAPAGGGGRFPAAHEPEVARAIAAQLDAIGAGYGFGALASGADILVAEALLARGAALHVVLPCGDAEFVRRSVHVGGADDARWAGRFAACLAAATDVVHATPDEVAVDDELFRYASRLAMGLALLRARHLLAPAVQLAVWDGEPTALRAGTAPDVAAWRDAGHSTVIVDPSGPDRRPPVATVADAAEPPSVRRVRAMLFGDIKGFSRIAEDQVPTFVTAVLGAFGGVLDEYGAAIEERNTWGDGIYVVVRDTATAARCALALQAAIERIDLPAHGLPPHLALRLGGHVGPVFALADAVAGRPSHFGTHVTRTARIEPVTPEGEVFVTEAFAAALALDDPSFRCEYVGHMPAAKGFGAMRMHSLRRGTLEVR